MIPYITILLIAVIGGFVHGIVGFVVWAVLGYVAVVTFGRVLVLWSGGVLPRKLRDQTATDFLAENSALVGAALPNMTAYQAKKRVEEILELMARRALRNNPSRNVETAFSAPVFLLSALDIAEDFPTAQEQELATKLVSFVRERWYR